MCEYAHAMGNSCGNLADYWRAIESHHGLQGGFIWEMLDHGILKSPGDPRPGFSSGDQPAYWAYGGDFGDEPHDGNFVCDGLFWPDRTPHPAMWEAKRLFQPFEAELLDPELAEAGRLRIHNKYDFRDLAHLAVSWAVTVDGTVVEAGTLRPLSTPPCAAEDISAPWTLPDLGPGQEAHVVLRFVDMTDVPLLGAGHEVGWVQLPLAVGAAAEAPAATASPTSTLAYDRPAGIIRGDRVEIALDTAGAALRAWRVDGIDLLASGPRVNTWRAPTDNDGIRLAADSWQHDRQAYFRWLGAGLDRLTPDPVTSEVGNDDAGRLVLALTEVLRAPDGAEAVRHEVVLAFDDAGGIDARHRFDVDEKLPDLPRIGVAMTIPAGLEQVEWFGRGPHESYVDRKVGAAVGRWQGSIDEQYVPYILPQEHGNKTDVRWLALRRPDGTGLLLSAPTPVEAGVSHYGAGTLGSARHTVDLVRDEVSHLTVDLRQRGLGGASCGPDTLEHYHVPSGTTYELRYSLVPLRAGDDPARVHRGRQP